MEAIETAFRCAPSGFELLASDQTLQSCKESLPATLDSSNHTLPESETSRLVPANEKAGSILVQSPLFAILLSGVSQQRVPVALDGIEEQGPGLYSHPHRSSLLV